MDNIKLEKLLIENMKAIFGFSLTRLSNVVEAEELASDIIYEILRSAHNLKDENRFYGFMWKISENVYINHLRKKSKMSGRTVELDENIADPSDSVIDKIVNKEELNLLRRELSLLSKQYRDVTVLYYIDDLSCSEISKKLNISEEMVKYYLFRARKIIREGMNMERLYGEKSYNANSFEIDFWGTAAGNDNEYKEFRKRKIKGNILEAAYYTPVTLQEISIELGVSMPYLEDEINILLEKQYLIHKNGKYLTNIPIFTLDCQNTINEKLKAITKETAKSFISVIDGFCEKFKSKIKNENIMRWQKALLCLHFALIATENDINNIYGDLPIDGPYSHLTGGCGFVWGRSMPFTENTDNRIQGIYNGMPSNDGRGSVIAMNFKQILNTKLFTKNMVDPIVCTAVDCFDYLPTEWQKLLEEMKFADNKSATFPVYSKEEYCDFKKILKECIDIVIKLNRDTIDVAARITSDLAPKHIRKTAEYVGAFIYCFNSIENLVDALFDMKYLLPVKDDEKPAICVIKN